MSVTSDELRKIARGRIEARRGFVPHLLAYVLVNAALIAIWFTVGHVGFFWPLIPLVLWGVGLGMHAWAAFFSKPVTETDVERELERLQRESGGTRAA